MEKLAALSLFLFLCFSVARAQISCAADCVCLVPVITSCINPVQRLSGFGTSLLEIVPGSFSQAAFVTDLRLADNAPLILRSDSFTGLTNISTLDLSGNAIADLPDGVFSTMPTLTSLDLSNNRLTLLNPGAFVGLNQLTTLILSENQLAGLPVTNITSLLPQLSSILTSQPDPVGRVHAEGLVGCSLGDNPIDCSREDIDSLYQLVRSGVVANGNRLRCSNGTSVIDLNIPIEITPTTTVSIATTSTVAVESTTVITIATPSMISSSSLHLSISPSHVISMTSSLVADILPSSTALPIPSPSSSSAEASSLVISATPTTGIEATPTPSLHATPTPALKATPTPLILLCSSQMTTLPSGHFNWSETLPLKEATLECPNGPEGGVARRACMASGEWDIVDDSECQEVESEATQLLARLSEIMVTPESSEMISSELASLPPSLLSLGQLHTVTDLAQQLLDVAGNDVQVLHNTLEALNTVFDSSSSTLREADEQTTNNIRRLIDTALLNALSADSPELAISFSHLAVGGAYLPATNHTHLLAIVKLSNDSVDLNVGGANDEPSDVMIEVTGSNSVQVTVYDQDELFDQSNCSNNSGVMVAAPIISVVDERGDSSNDSVVISYERVMSPGGDVMYVCARWSQSDERCDDGGGRWLTNGCMLSVTENEVLQCQCLHRGTFTLITVPSVTTPPPVTTPPQPADDGGLSLPTRIVFYTFCSLAIPFYLIIIITILLHSDLRSQPLMQCLVNLALSQSLTSLLLMMSYEVTSSRWVCYGLGVVLQYMILVSLSWMVIQPVLVCLELFKRLWYEKQWLIAPFAIACWVWPAVLVGVYYGLRYSSFPEQPIICWLESVVFPSVVTYVCAFVSLVVIATTLLTPVLLLCSNFEIDLSAYFKPVGTLLNFVLYIGVVLAQFFTAAANQFNINPFYLLPVTGGLMILCASSFFAIYGIVYSKVRKSLLCRFQRRKPRAHSPAAYSSARTSQSSFRMKSRRAPTRLNDEMNINYVDDYLGYPRHPQVPMVMLNQVIHGRVVRRTDPHMGGVIVTNPMYRFSLTSDP